MKSIVVIKCCLTCTGAVNISKVLRSNETLKYLNISDNPVGDDGISVISDGLYINATLIQLVARSCEFHSKGAKSIGEMLQTNKTLKYLDISGNHIEDDGITARDQPIMLLFLPIMLSCSALKIHLFDYYAFYTQFCMSNSLHVADNFYRLFY